LIETNAAAIAKSRVKEPGNLEVKELQGDDHQAGYEKLGGAA
jgi:hypothetical protein